MIGILVHGDNHFIVSGPKPDRAAAIALAQYWSVIRISAKMPPELLRWSIVTRAFRENLEWAVVVADDRPHSAAVVELLVELAARGVVS